MEANRAARTPWVLTLKLDNDKLIRGSMLRTVLEKLRDRYHKEFEVQEMFVHGDQNPEIAMRVKSEYMAKQGAKFMFGFIKQKEVEVKNLVVTGIRGIKDVKTTRRITYAYETKDPVNMALEKRRDTMVFDVIGCNLRECLSHALVDSNKSSCNDLTQVCDVLGIEAARRCLLN